MSTVRLVTGFFVFILKGTLVSILATTVMFVAGFSVATRQFPPDVAKLQSKLREAKTFLVAFVSIPVAKSNSGNQVSIAKSEKFLDIDEMIRVQENKIKLGREIANVIAPGQVPEKTRSEMILEIEQLQGRVKFLKGRVLRLESELQKR